MPQHWGHICQNGSVIAEFPRNSCRGLPACHLWTAWSVGQRRPLGSCQTPPAWCCQPRLCLQPRGGPPALTSLPPLGPAGFTCSERGWWSLWRFPFLGKESWQMWLKGLLCWFSGYRVCLQCRRPGFDPWAGKIPWSRAWKSTPVFWPGEAHGQRSLVGYSSWGCKESDTTEQLTLSLSSAFHGLLQFILTKSLRRSGREKEEEEDRNEEEEEKRRRR